MKFEKLAKGRKIDYSQKIRYGKLRMKQGDL